MKSFAPISLAGIAPLIITVNKDFPVRDVKELIDYAKANPNNVSFGSSGVGSATHLTFELLKQTAGIEMVHVPYKGTAPALAAELAKVVGSPEMKERFEKLGIEAVGNSPAEARKFLESKVAKWGKVITTAGVKAE